MIISKITEPLKEICCGAMSSYALTIDGSLYSWGANDQGQLGYVSSNNIKTPQKVKFDQQISQITAGETHAALVNIKNTCFTWGSNHKGQLGHKIQGVG